MGPLNGLQLRLEVLLHFHPQVRHLGRVALQLGLFVSGTDGVLAGVSRHFEDGVRIELLLGRSGLAPLTRFLFAPTPRLVLPLARVLLLLLPQAFFLFLPRFLLALFLLTLAFSTLFLLLRPQRVRASRGGTPQSFGGFMPAFLAKLARRGNVFAADPALTWGALRPRGEEHTAPSNNQGQEGGADPQAVGPPCGQ